MDIRKLSPPTPADVADWSDAVEIQKRMIETIEAMSHMAADVGLARHVLTYDSDRKKRALSRAMAASLAGGESVAKSEAEARSSEIYSKELDQLGREDLAAQQTIADWETKKLIWSTCQSLLALQRESVKRL